LVNVNPFTRYPTAALAVMVQDPGIAGLPPPTVTLLLVNEFPGSCIVDAPVVGLPELAKGIVPLKPLPPPPPLRVTAVTVLPLGGFVVQWASGFQLTIQEGVVLNVATAAAPDPPPPLIVTAGGDA
jgi:hypothetical protein